MFKDKIGSVSDEDAFVRPIPELYSVAEHVSHMLEWRKECILRFKDNKELSKQGWTNLKNALCDSRIELIELFTDQDDSYLETVSAMRNIISII